MQEPALDVIKLHEEKSAVRGLSAAQASIFTSEHLAYAVARDATARSMGDRCSVAMAAKIPFANRWRPGTYI